ncbi:hypothetical protein ACQPYA_03830 [Micromonospora sp. CA-263727]|uniref:hypothetical protein n=1 Tax=Micromonospora sp. CA-263727 TaxID=3239967 RepID=UPI003D8E59F5
MLVTQTHGMGADLAIPGKQPWYPLIDAGWDRDRCLTELHRWYGFEWPRSCCGFCLMWNLAAELGMAAHKTELISPVAGAVVTPNA